MNGGVFDSFISRRNAKNDKPLSPKTVRLYKCILADLERWECFRSIEHLNEKLMLEYINRLQGRYAPMAVAVRATIIASFFSECVEMGIIAVSPMAGITVKKPKVKNKPAFPIVLLRERFISACKTARTQLFVYNFSYTGMRIGEAAALRWDAVDFRDKTIQVQGKTGRRQVPVHKDYLEILTAHKNGSPYLFPHRSDKQARLTPEFLSREFKGIAAVAQMPSVTSHTFRRSVATHLLRKTGDAKTVAGILGMTVEILLKHYIDSDLERQHEVMELL